MVRRYRVVIAGALAMLAALWACGSCLAARYPRISVAPPGHLGPPSIAAGRGPDERPAAYVAWVNSDPSFPQDSVGYCVIPDDGRACSHSGRLFPADGLQYITAASVVVNGPTVAIFAVVLGNTPGNGHYSPVQEWQSTDGGATFHIVNGGLSVAAGYPSADTSPVNAVAVPGANSISDLGSNWLGFGWDTAGTPGPPSFNVFSLGAPGECSSLTPCPYATLEPPSNPDQLQNQPGQFASYVGYPAIPERYRGIMGVFFTNFTSGPLGCSNARTVPFGMAYVYGYGLQSLTNDYGVSPGSPNSAWRVPLTQGDCNVDNLAVEGGPGGFGVLENDELHGMTIYRRFDPPTLTLGSRLIIDRKAELSASISNDVDGNEFATFLEGGSGGPIVMAWGGTIPPSFSRPVVLYPNASHAAGHVVNASFATLGWIAWQENGAIFARQFDQLDALDSPSVLSGTATSTARSLSVTVGCALAPCTVTVTIRSGRTKLAGGSVTLRTQASHRMKLNLTPAGRQLRQRHRETIRARITLAEKIHGHVLKTTRTIKVMPHR